MTAIILAAGFGAGVALGLFFFGGLWLTIVRLPKAHHPAVLAVASFWIRLLTVLSVMYFSVQRGWQFSLVLLTGFAAGRIATSAFLPDRRPTHKCT